MHDWGISDFNTISNAYGDNLTVNAFEIFFTTAWILESSVSLDMVAISCCISSSGVLSLRTMK